MQKSLQKYEVPHDFNIFNKSRVDLIKHSYHLWPLFWNNFDFNDKNGTMFSLLSQVHQVPASIHVAMFTKCIDIMGSESQRAELLGKCYNADIIGCYAQTELGHGSDVQGL
jgi:hypothetical protein